MAFIVTSKNKARPPSNDGGHFRSSRTRVYDEQIHAEVSKSEKDLADQRKWNCKSQDERTRIALDGMKRDAAESCRSNGIEVNSAKLDKVFSEVAEQRDRIK